jgi:hypothetical protein
MDASALTMRHFKSIKNTAHLMNKQNFLRDLLAYNIMNENQGRGSRQVSESYKGFLFAFIFALILFGISLLF